MASFNRDTIDTFMSITGAPETVALQKLEEYAGNLNEAVNAHFSEGDRNVMQEAPVTATAPLDDLMDIDDPTSLVHRGPSSLFSATRGMNPFSLLDPTFQRGLFDAPDIFNRPSELIERGRAPFVSQPREVRQIPIEVRDGPDNSATQPGHGPRIEDVTDVIDVEGSEMHGPVIVDEEDDEDITRNYQGITRPSAPQFDASADYGNDIEEEMIRAAIEASKRDAELQNNNEGLDYVEPQQRASQHDDTDIAHAVSLSLRTAEQEKTQREPVLEGGVSGSNVDRPINVGELANVVDSNQRQEAGSSSIQDEVDELDEQPLVRHRSGQRSSGFVEVERNIEETEVNTEPSHPVPTTDSQTPLNGSAFATAEWGGISSEEHDEAVMLEAAMFGGIPENGYPLPYTSHQLRPGVETAWSAPRPPSPSVVAQRAIREQQDDEYLASLQADREKELIAIAEENAAREAALEEQRRKDEESQRKLQEEQELERQLAAKQASLPEEPALNDENAITLLVRMPDGSRHGRRFRKSDKLQALFNFIDVGRMLKPGTYRLVRPYPRQAFSDGESNLSLSELGLTSKQEALFLELI
ncbi:plant UBX domain-containing protein 8-like [Silene latifolia]|uniref:plant UBX domain-containing protein 8-like n=1 Tax=Silene latifolia TaxID=37657 RepID=UPI003D77A6CB